MSGTWLHKTLWKPDFQLCNQSTLGQRAEIATKTLKSVVGRQYVCNLTAMPPPLFTTDNRGGGNALLEHVGSSASSGYSKG